MMVADFTTAQAADAPLRSARRSPAFARGLGKVVRAIDGADRRGCARARKPWADHAAWGRTL